MTRPKRAPRGGPPGHTYYYCIRKRFMYIMIVMINNMASGQSWAGILRDLRYGWRGMRKTPGFTAFAVLTLGLGIGANTTVFTIVNTLLLHPLPVGDPSRGIRIVQRELGQPEQVQALSVFRVQAGGGREVRRGGLQFGTALVAGNGQPLGQ